MKKYYAVRQGRTPGVYEAWAECQKQVIGYPGASFKSFLSREEALFFVTGEEKKEKKKSEVYAYVDGSFLAKTGEFSFGAVIFYNGEILKFSEKFSDSSLSGMRNVAGEIKGAEFVMDFAEKNKIPELDIYYDYMGIEKWCTGEWKANKAGTAAYRDFYNKIKDSVRVNFIKVKGHSGDEYNDMADALAKAALGIK